MSGPSDEQREWARKVRREYADGELVRVAGSRNQAEAELIQNLLLERGVPSMLRRTAGFDVPDMLAAGPRDVLVPSSGAGAARQALVDAQLVEDVPARDTDVTSPRYVLAGLLAALVLVAVVAWLGVELAS